LESQCNHLAVDDEFGFLATDIVKEHIRALKKRTLRTTGEALDAVQAALAGTDANDGLNQHGQAVWAQNLFE
jgi:hypothetical protein